MGLFGRWRESRDENARMRNWWAANTEPGPEMTPEEHRAAAEAGMYTSLAEHDARFMRQIGRLAPRRPDISLKRDAHYGRAPQGPAAYWPAPRDGDDAPGDMRYPAEWDWGE